jgi:hypothetical protein
MSSRPAVVRAGRSTTNEARLRLRPTGVGRRHGLVTQVTRASGSPCVCVALRAVGRGPPWGRVSGADFRTWRGPRTFGEVWCPSTRSSGPRRPASRLNSTSTCPHAHFPHSSGRISARRVEGWRGAQSARLQPPPVRTAHTDFPYAALLPASCQELCDLSGWARCQTRTWYCTR